jgi:hypothetical protein
VAHGQLGPVVYTPLISHQGLEQASKLFYSDGDLVQMFNQLDRLHEEMHSTVRSSEGRPSLTPLQTVETPDEAKFIREFGAELDRALALSRSYRKVWDTEDLVRAHRPDGSANAQQQNEAWAVYYKSVYVCRRLQLTLFRMYRTFNGAISSVTSLDLR